MGFSLGRNRPPPRPGTFFASRLGFGGRGSAAAARSKAGIESLPPYDLRHAFASLQIRAGMSIPELAEQMGHSPQMTIGTYAHVIRELKGEPAVSAEQQIEAARQDNGGRLVDVDAV
jgi:integrase